MQSRSVGAPVINEGSLNERSARRFGPSGCGSAPFAAAIKH